MNVLRELGFTCKLATVITVNKTVNIHKLDIHKILINENIDIDSNTRRLLDILLIKYEDRFAAIDN